MYADIVEVGGTNDYLAGFDSMEGGILDDWQLDFYSLACHDFNDEEEGRADEYTVVSGRLNVVKGLKRTYQSVTTGESRHFICQERTYANIYLARDHSIIKRRAIPTLIHP
jgi:hypothetical protein